VTEVATFLGGIHWGITAQRPHHQQSFHYIRGITPSLIAWLGLIMPAYAGLPMIAALSCFIGAVQFNQSRHAKNLLQLKPVVIVRDKT
jgi:hypothetical protein